MKKREEIINDIIVDIEAKSYLEIGFGSGTNFDKIVAEEKVSVDPVGEADHQMTSDDFFKQNENIFDVIHIDGDHSAEQVRKDISNSLKCLSKEGVIILHDSIPGNEEMQQVPWTGKAPSYTGQVWRSIVGFIKSYPKIKVETYRSDWGVSVIYPKGLKSKKHFEEKEMTYKQFKKDEKSLLNIVD